MNHTGSRRWMETLERAKGFILKLNRFQILMLYICICLFFSPPLSLVANLH